MILELQSNKVIFKVQNYDAIADKVNIKLYTELFGQFNINKSSKMISIHYNICFIFIKKPHNKQEMQRKVKNYS